MQFLPYATVRERELATGHDLILGSCLNLAAGAGVEDGEATYVGQHPEWDSRVFLFMTIHGDASLYDQAGNMLLSGVDLENEQDTLAMYHWAVGL